jgi:hypothetical protein
MLEKIMCDMRTDVSSVLYSYILGPLWYKTLEASHGPEKSKKLNYADGSRDDYLMDMFVAVMDIGLLISRRVPFVNFEEAGSRDDVCPGCGNSVSDHQEKDFLGATGPVQHIINFWKHAWHDEVDEVNWYSRGWALALLHALPDGSIHPFRSAVSRYITLPSLLPPRGPNDPSIRDDPIARPQAYNLFKLLLLLPKLIRRGQMLATEPSPISGLDNLSISDTEAPVDSSKHD